MEEAIQKIENIFVTRVNEGSLLWLPALAGRICYSDEPVEELIKNDKRVTSDNLKYLAKLVRMGHLSVFEHLTISITINDVRKAIMPDVTLYDLIRGLGDDVTYMLEVAYADLYLDQHYPVGYDEKKETKGFFRFLSVLLRDKFQILPYTETAILINLRHLLEHRLKQFEGDTDKLSDWFVEKFGNAIPPEDWRPQLITTAEINDGQGKLHLVRIVVDESKVVGVTFIVEGCSRVMTHQLVRHRLYCSYSQRSHRHTKVKDETEFVYPPLDYIKLKKVRKQLHELFKESYKQSLDNYKLLTEDGIMHKEERFVVRKEDARFIIPDGVKTTIMVTMLTDGYRNFIKERIEQGAQWEIREIAERLSGFLPEFRDK